MNPTLLAEAPPIVRLGAAPEAASAPPAAQLLATLGAMPPRIAPKFLYDATGCALYEQICELPEYYLPRVERAILDRHQRALLAALPPRAEWVDVGCGDGRKARRWLQAGVVARYVGLDIAEDWLRATLAATAADFAGVDCAGVVLDLEHGFALPPRAQPALPRVIWYPGSSIGNFEPADALRLLRQMRAALRPGDALLLGADGPTERARQLRAYDDARGVTAAFNLNVLRVANRLLGADFDAAQFAHRAHFDAAASRIEMHLVARRAQQVALAPGRRLVLAAGDWIVTEHSYKHPTERLLQLLRQAGFARVQRFGMDGEGFGMYLGEVAHG